VSDIVRLDAATLGAKIAAKELSSVEVTQACLDQIAATDESYHAFLHVAADQALATAARIDAMALTTIQIQNPAALKLRNLSKKSKPPKPTIRPAH
jgi:aspartyl-tRNA(Asn)/glutamyl-tRNA(Gln) amidotransferase subunit A